MMKNQKISMFSAIFGVILLVMAILWFLNPLQSFGGDQIFPISLRSSIFADYSQDQYRVRVASSSDRPTTFFQQIVQGIQEWIDPGKINSGTEMANTQERTPPPAISPMTSTSMPSPTLSGASTSIATTPAPSKTAAQPTITKPLLNTLSPTPSTKTMTATHAAVYTITSTPQHSATPVSTLTATPAPTHTPLPSATHQPTATLPLPAPTLEPTDAAYPPAPTALPGYP
jgi:hypothetical protein